MCRHKWKALWVYINWKGSRKQQAEVKTSVSTQPLSSRRLRARAKTTQITCTQLQHLFLHPWCGQHRTLATSTSYIVELVWAPKDVKSPWSTDVQLHYKAESMVKKDKDYGSHNLSAHCLRDDLLDPPCASFNGWEKAYYQAMMK